MEELIIKEAMGLGVLGVGAVILFKTFLQEKSDDKLYYREQIEKTDFPNKAYDLGASL